MDMEGVGGGSGSNLIYRRVICEERLRKAQNLISFHKPWLKTVVPAEMGATHRPNCWGQIARSVVY